jgi:hypothetical protein
LGAPNQIGKNKGNHFVSLTQGGARSSLAPGYFHIVPPGLQSGSLRSRFGRTTKSPMERHFRLMPTFQRDVIATHSVHCLVTLSFFTVTECDKHDLGSWSIAGR